jgi:integral membrane protein
MIHLLKTKIGRLRIIGFLEGISLLALIFIAMPMKHYFDDASLSKFLGPVHGAIFLLFLFNTLSVGVEQNWKFKTTTWKVLLACFVPFGTFYIDNKILSKLKDIQ